MFQNFLNIYFIFVFCIIIELNCRIEREIGATEIGPLADFISEEKCDSNLTLCCCDDVRNLMDEGDCCSVLSCLDSEKYIELEVYKSAFLPARILPGFHIAMIALHHPNVNVDENIFEEISSIEEFNVHQSNIQVIYLFSLKFLKFFISKCILKNCFPLKITSLITENILFMFIIIIITRGLSPL